MSAPWRLIYVLIAANVLLRVFTIRIPVLPKALNIIDLPLALLIAAAGILMGARHVGAPSISRLLVSFNLVTLAGTISNSGYLSAAPALSQWLMWNTPILLGISITRLAPNANALARLLKLLLTLLTIQIVLGILQVPLYLKTNDSEQILGTFFGNAEQYQAFLMLGVFYSVARIRLDPARARRWWLLAGMILTLIVIIDNKASWLGLVASLGAVLTVTGTRWSFPSARAKLAVLAVMALTVLVALALRFSPSLDKFQALGAAITDGRYNTIEKIRAYSDIADAFTRHPHMLVVGSGLGNFYSRAARQFHYIPRRSADFLAGDLEDRPMSHSLGALTDGLAVREPFYTLFERSSPVLLIGSGKLDEPFSSFAGLLGETGCLGALLYLLIYLRAYRALRDYMTQSQGVIPAQYCLAAMATGFMVYLLFNSVHGAWLETTRLTTIAWTLIGAALSTAPVRSDDDALSKMQVPPPRA